MEISVLIRHVSETLKWVLHAPVEITFPMPADDVASVMTGTIGGRHCGRMDRFRSSTISQPGDYPYSFRTAFLIVAAALLQPSPAQAESRSKVEFDIANGKLSSTLVELAKQARIPIGMIGDADRDIRTPAIKGRLSVDQALRRLLSGSGLTFRRTRSGDYVIIGARRVHARPAERLPRAPSRAMVEDPGPIAAAETIVVTASKSDIPLSHFPGTVAVLTLDGEQIASRPEGGTAVLVDNMPLLAATNLGPGRNKIFARGIADSSFNGQSQANVSLYFDELRLSYAGPDPDLNLFDVRRVEVLPGPYGTLYGAGALGGVVRIEPNAPDPTRVEGTIAAHTSDVRYGARGGGLAAALNIPLVSDRLAVRLTGYRTIDPGYIDDTLRGVEDVNRVKTVGGRGLLRFESDEGLAIDLGLIFQRISAADSQYSNDSDNSLRKQVAQAQPYSSSFLMPSLTLRKHWDNLELVSATGWSRQRGEGIADSLGVLSYPESRRTSFLSHETRVSGDAGAFNFLAGLSFARNASREDRALRIFDTEFDRFELRGRTDDLALFGEARTMLSDTITVTAGGRLNYIRDVRHTYFNEQDEAASAARSRISLLPSAALSWTPRAPLLIFLAYRSGSRGGQSVAHSGSDEAGNRHIQTRSARDFRGRMALLPFQRIRALIDDVLHTVE